ncbi:MAG: peptidoglycan bridge formation glycyltransferase FemA/FemB family protein [bacterium]|nr:peptidoglycan bridge formation glycyltransferase FemA/FemB family protein [bacterium]
MKLILDPSYEVWDAFHSHVPWSQFTQSWAWGSFRSSTGVQVARVALEGKEGRWLISAQMEFRARRGGLGYWYAPRGPVFSSRVPMEKRRMLFQRFITELNTAGLKDALFLRVEPHAELKKPEGLLPRISKDGRLFSFVRAPALNPSSTRLIDLSKPVDVLLSEMHQKTRYNIRVAERNEVKVRVTRSQEDIEFFFSLLADTAQRGAFVPQSCPYLRDMIRMLSERDMLRLRVAEVNGVMSAGSVEILYGDTVTYLHGASSNDERNVMAPYALHWDAIVSAQREGFQWYDFWGENPSVSAMPDWKSSWEGISRFKQGWGGRHIDMAGTWDLPYNRFMYELVFLLRRFKK